MKWFIDTEFYEQGGDGVMRIEWISIAMVSASGVEFYAENDDFDWDKVPADDWLCENVKPFLIQDRVPDIAMSSREVADWMISECGDAPEFYGRYADYDWCVICSMFGRMSDLPKHFPKFCWDLKQTAMELGIDSKELPEQGDDEHNALNDAKWNLLVYGYTEGVRERLRETGVLPFLPTDHAENLAASVKDFIGSVSYVAPEALGLHVQAKLIEPLSEYRQAVADSGA